MNFYKTDEIGQLYCKPKCINRVATLVYIGFRYNAPQDLGTYTFTYIGFRQNRLRYYMINGTKVHQ